MKTKTLTKGKRFVTRCLAMVLSVAMVLPFSVLPAAAQEPGEAVSLTLPRFMGSLKSVPLMQEIIQMLANPYGPDGLGLTADDGRVTRRQSFGVTLPQFLVHPLNMNPMTAQPMALLFDPATGASEISWNIPSVDTPAFPFLADLGLIASLATDTTTSLLQRNNGAGLQAIPPGTLANPSLETPINANDLFANPANPAASRTAANRLGKALFWDMQVGSDGIQACGSCHFHAGVDNRTKNQLNPNHLGPKGNFATLDLKQPTQDVTPEDFPFHKLLNLDIPGEPLLNPNNVLSDTDDVMSSMGVVFSPFTDIIAPGPGAFGPATQGVVPLLPDIRTVGATDPVPAFQGIRRVEPRNTPTFHGVVFNFDNFWDGRARHDFNGGSVFGASDPAAHIFINTAGVLSGGTNADIRPGIDPAIANLPIRIHAASLASLATGPGLSEFEMSFAGRNWAKIGKKLLQTGVTPLANQLVSTTDSVLGPLSNQGGSACPAGSTAPGKPGLCTTYNALIQQAFGARFHNNTTQHLNGCYTDGRTPACPAGTTPDPFDGYVLTAAAGAANPINTNQFTQMEANFSLFWGLSIQAYGELVIPDDTPFDRFMDANPNQFLGTVPGAIGNPTAGGLTDRQLHGLDLFIGQNHSGKNPFFKVARCGICHNGPELTDHSFNADTAMILPDLVTGAPRIVSGFHLEDEMNGTAQDAVEMDNISLGINTLDLKTPTFGQDVNGHPTGHTLLDNGIYDIGVRPIAEDVGRGGNDPFGFPLSLAALTLQNVGITEGAATPAPRGYTVTPLTELQRDAVGAPVLDPATLQPLPPVQAGVDIAFTPQLPPYLAPWANDLSVGDAWPLIDRTIFNPDTADPYLAINLGFLNGTYPNPNRVGRMGSFKAPSLRNVEMTGPYFHNGGKLTLRQVVDFYDRGGDFPATNTLHRDPQIVNLGNNFFSQLTEDDKDALVDFLLALTDQRVKFERAPFDRPEIFVPLDGTAPDNTTGRAGLVGNALFSQVAEVGAAGHADPLPNFLNISSNFADKGTGRSHFDAFTGPRPAPPDGSFSGTGTVTVKDALRALRIAVNLVTPTVQDLLHGDVSPVGAPDGSINVDDALLILKKAVGIAI